MYLRFTVLEKQNNGQKGRIFKLQTVVLYAFYVLLTG